MLTLDDRLPLNERGQGHTTCFA